MMLVILVGGGYLGYGWAIQNGYIDPGLLNTAINPIRQKLGLTSPPGATSSPPGTLANQSVSPEKSVLVSHPQPSKPSEKIPATAAKKSDPAEEVLSALSPEDQLKQKISQNPDSPPSDYLELAKLLESEGKRKQAGNTLKSGIGRHPENRDLLLALADNLEGQGRKTEAWLLLARSGIFRDADFARRILKLGLATGHPDETLVIVDPLSPSAPHWTEEERMTIGRLQEAVGNYSTSLKIFSQLPDGEIDSYRVKAKQSHKIGDKAEALSFQIEYVNHLPDPDAEALTFLSELHRLNGNREEADKAYQLALGRLQGAR